MLFSIFLLFLTTSAEALILGGNSNVNFNYNNPGARANAMGGAFISLADDATAAYTNPAGLSILSKPEVSLEYKINNFTNRLYDTSSTLHSSDYNSTTNDVSFMSFSYPSERVNFTLYRHLFMNSETTGQKVINYSPFPFVQINDVNDKRHIVTYGLSGSFKVLSNLSLGLSVGFDESKVNYSSVTTYTSGIAAKDNKFWDYSSQSYHASVSLLWNPVSTFNIGMVYRSGPSFEHNVTVTEVTATTSIYTFKDKTKMPDFYGIGASYRFPIGLTVAVDYNYIMYSQITNNNVFYNGTTQLGTLSNTDYKVDDNYELHAGVEYAFQVKEMPLAIRGGYCYKRDHNIYYVPNSSTAPLSATYAANSLGNGVNRDEHIFSFGLGAVLGKNFQLDLSGSWGTFSQEYITSLVYRF